MPVDGGRGGEQRGGRFGGQLPGQLDHPPGQQPGRIGRIAFVPRQVVRLPFSGNRGSQEGHEHIGPVLGHQRAQPRGHRGPVGPGAYRQSGGEPLEQDRIVAGTQQDRRGGNQFGHRGDGWWQRGGGTTRRNRAGCRDLSGCVSRPGWAGRLLAQQCVSLAAEVAVEPRSGGT
ncbi:hypothetical protein [Actinoplanes sp. NPDC051859]|uniref:hypothetical protein n=1 Tax=Actinoplanes sp. NPDC051859 TaxID=3363909 RepID=UPI003795842E